MIISGELLISQDETRKWEDRFRKDTKLQLWLKNSSKYRDSANAMIYSLRDISAAAVRRIYFPDDVELFPIDQIRHLGFFEKFTPTKLQKLSFTKHALLKFQFKLTRESDKQLSNFLSEEIIREMTDQQAQLALSYVYTLVTLNNLIPHEVSEGRATTTVVKYYNDQREKIDGCIRQFVEYVGELKEKAQSTVLFRDLALKIARKMQKDVSIELGMTEQEIVAFINQLECGFQQ